jgi:CheY-like chemotaxis protein
VAVLDLKLPKVSRVDVLKQIKTDPNPKTVRVVLTSSSASRALKRHWCAQAAGRTC